MPVEGDKVICVQNYWQKLCGDYPSVNGMIGFTSNLKDNNKNDAYCTIDFSPDFLEKSVAVRALKT